MYLRLFHAEARGDLPWLFKNNFLCGDYTKNSFKYVHLNWNKKYIEYNLTNNFFKTTFMENPATSNTFQDSNIPSKMKGIYKTYIFPQ